MSESRRSTPRLLPLRTRWRRTRAGGAAASFGRRLAGAKGTRALKETLLACLRYRVTGLAAEAAFFTYVFVLGRAAYLRGETGDIDAALLEDRVASAG